MAETEDPTHPTRETDACAQIARCHRHQYPHEYGRPAIYHAWTADEAIELAPIVDHAPGGDGC
jgi:hypothetical protein